jgi:hypothetical protein
LRFLDFREFPRFPRIFNFFEVHHLQGLLQRDYPEQWLEHPGICPQLGGIGKSELGLIPDSDFHPGTANFPFRTIPEMSRNVKKSTKTYPRGRPKRVPWQLKFL